MSLGPDWAVLVCLLPRTSPTMISPGSNHLMSAQTSLCRRSVPTLPSGGVGEPLTVEMTFTLAASAAIWQSHQENFTCLTFTCPRAVNTAFFWRLRTSPSLSDFSGVERREPEKPGGKDGVPAGKHVHTRHGIGHTAGKRRPFLSAPVASAAPWWPEVVKLFK